MSWVLPEPGLEFLVEQDAQSADFVIKGRIVQMEEKKLFHKPWQKKIRMSHWPWRALSLVLRQRKFWLNFPSPSRAKAKWISLGNWDMTFD